MGGKMNESLYKLYNQRFPAYPLAAQAVVHGLGGNRWTNYPVAEMFLEKGYNIVTYDQRSSGENTAQYTRYGYWESSDLQDCITYLENSIGESRAIGTWGLQRLGYIRVRTKRIELLTLRF